MYTMIPFHHRNRNNLMTAFDTPFFREFFAEPGKMTMRVDVIRQEENYQLKADLPGANKDDIRLELKDGVLTISAEVNVSKKEEKEGYIYNERRYGRRERSFQLEDIDEENITADYTDGVLTVTLPRMKTEEKPDARLISIQ